MDDLTELYISSFAWCYNPPHNDKVWGTFLFKNKNFVFWGKRNPKGKQKLTIKETSDSIGTLSSKFKSKTHVSNTPDKLYKPIVNFDISKTISHLSLLDKFSKEKDETLKQNQLDQISLNNKSNLSYAEAIYKNFKDEIMDDLMVFLLSN